MPGLADDQRCSEPLIPITIDLDVVFPLFGQIFFRIDSSHRTNWHARPTANAVVWVNVELFRSSSARFINSWMNRVHRAGVEACCVFRADAWFSNNVSHESS